jgi:alkylated DNA repair dioxygenase AlkB
MQALQALWPIPDREEQREDREGVSPNRSLRRPNPVGQIVESSGNESLSLPQNKNEKDFSAPIVSVSLGLPARFLFGGTERSDPTTSVPLHHGDVVVWGGPSRLRYHGVAPVLEGSHPLTGRYRVNLTFRRAA